MAEYETIKIPKINRFRDVQLHIAQVPRSGIDISDSTVTPETLQSGIVAYDRHGNRILGTGYFMTTVQLSYDGDLTAETIISAINQHNSEIPIGSTVLVEVSGDDGMVGVLLSKKSNDSGGGVGIGFAHLGYMELKNGVWSSKLIWEDPPILEEDNG